TSAARALEGQPIVTGLAVFGMTCLAGTLSLVIIAGAGLFLWFTLNGQLLVRGRILPHPYSRPRSRPRRMRLSSTALSQAADLVPVSPEPPVTIYGYSYPDEIEIIPFTLPEGWSEGEWPDVFWTGKGR